MASDTVPAAVPGPHDPPHSTAPTAPQDGAQQQPGGLAGLLAPVGPARTAAFTLNPSHTSENEAVTGTSSSAYQNTETADNNAASSKNTGQGKQERSVVRAWLLAGAERWRKGADVRNKRLDIKKARAQARQVKETVTVNRSEKTGDSPSNSSTGSNSGAGKSLGSKSGKGSDGNGPKNSSGGTRNGNSGRSGGSTGGGHNPSTGHGTSGNGGSGAPGGSAGHGTGKHTSSKSGPDAKPPKDRRGDGTSSSGKNHPSNSSGAGAGGGKPGTGKGTDSSSGPKTGDSGRTGSGGASGGNTGSQGNPGKDAPSPSGKSTDAGNGKVDLDKPKKTKADGERQRGPDTETSRKAPGSDGADGQDARTKPGKNSKPGKGDKGGKGGKDREAPNNANSKNNNGRDTRTPPPGQTPLPAPRTSLDTQASREAGYRDGTRIGKVVAHTQAYRDGYRDGRTDTQEAAAHDKARLDKAREDRKTARPHPDKDRPVTQPAASSADYQPTVPPKPDHAPGPQPVQVTSTDTTHIHLGTNAARPHVSRGEVRTLRQFQQRLDTKTDTMTGVAEATRVLEQHATEQSKQVTQYLEQARGVEGGDKLVTALTRLAEAAQVQAGKAAEIHKRALRASEACTVLSANTETRYDGIYQAVVDSPETSPAEMRYYREMGYASV